MEIKIVHFVNKGEMYIKILRHYDFATRSGIRPDLGEDSDCRRIYEPYKHSWGAMIQKFTAEQKTQRISGTVIARAAKACGSRNPDDYSKRVK